MTSPAYTPFVNRQHQIHEAQSRLDAMLSDTWVRDSVLLYHGAPQIGKTALLGEVRRRMSGQGIPTAWVDFATEGLKPTQMLKQIRDGWARTADVVSDASIDENMPPDDAADRLFDFASTLSRVSLRRPCAVFLDALEMGQPKELLWLQEKVLLPLIDKFRILVVMAARQPALKARWSHSLERRIARFALETFSVEETARQIEESEGAGVVRADELVQYTNAVPGLNALGIRWLTAPHSPAPGPLLRHLADAILAGLQPDYLKAYLLVVSALRQFDRDLLEALVKALREYDEELPQELKPIAIERNIEKWLQDLSEKGLIEPSPEGFGQTVSPAVRPVLDAYLQQINPQLYLHIQMNVLEWFTSRVDKGDYGNIVNQLYHQARVVNGAGHVVIPNKSFPAVVLDPKQFPQQLETALEAVEKRSSRPFELVSRIERGLRDIEGVLPADTASRLRKVSQKHSAKYLSK